MSRSYNGEFESKLRSRMAVGAFLLTIALAYLVEWLFPDFIYGEWGFIAIPIGIAVQFWFLHLTGEIPYWIIQHLRSRQ